MSSPTLMKQSRIAVADVVVRDRLRPVSQAGVAALRASIAELGVMKDAIHVRRHHSGEYRLLAGAHRLAVAQELGWDEIEAKIWTDVTDDWARLIEIDDNLAGAEMNALDTAVFLATRKAVYERLHPEKKRGFAGALAKHGAATELGSFADATAEKFNLTPRQVYKIVSAGARLQPDEIATLRAAPKPVTLKDLQVIAKANSTDRYFIVDLLSKGEAKSAADAIKRSLGAPKLSDAQQKMSALIGAWSRASIEVRLEFVQARWAEMTGLLRDAEPADAEPGDADE